MNHMTGLFCLDCGNKVRESEFMLKCPSCNGVLEVRYDLENMKTSLLSRSPKKRTGSFLEQWLDILPINNPPVPYQDKIPHPVKPEISAVEAFLKQEKNI